MGTTWTCHMDGSLWTEAASQSAMEAFGKQPNARDGDGIEWKNAAAVQHGLVCLAVAGSERNIHRNMKAPLCKGGLKKWIKLSGLLQWAGISCYLSDLWRLVAWECSLAPSPDLSWCPISWSRDAWLMRSCGAKGFFHKNFTRKSRTNCKNVLTLRQNMSSIWLYPTGNGRLTVWLEHLDFRILYLGGGVWPRSRSLDGPLTKVDLHRDASLWQIYTRVLKGKIQRSKQPVIRKK